MLKTLLNLLFIVFIIVVVFVVTRKIVMMWTGCTREEATKMIQNFILQKDEYHLATDKMLFKDVEDAVKVIIGDVRHEELMRLARISSLIDVNFASGLPYIAITVNYVDENEKCRLENILSDLVSKYLDMHCLCKNVLVDWKENSYFKLPALMIRYAETEEEQKILKRVLQQEAAKITIKYKPIKDDDV